MSRLGLRLLVALALGDLHRVALIDVAGDIGPHTGCGLDLHRQLGRHLPSTACTSPPLMRMYLRSSLIKKAVYAELLPAATSSRMVIGWAEPPNAEPLVLRGSRGMIVPSCLGTNSSGLCSPTTYGMPLDTGPPEARRPTLEGAVRF